jgi:hypothetical protein
LLGLLISFGHGENKTGARFMSNDVFLRALPHRKPLRSVLARRFIKQFSLISYEKRLSIEAVDRPNYGYCIFQAAKIAALAELPTNKRD